MIKQISNLIIGTEIEDMEAALEYIYFDEKEYPIKFKIAKCKCGCDEFLFQQELDAKNTAVCRVCLDCENTHYVCDSEQRWGELWPMNMMCGCGSGGWNIGVVFSLYEEGGEVRRITVVARCCECHHIDYICEWDIDYKPSRHLLDSV